MKVRRGNMNINKQCVTVVDSLDRLDLASSSISKNTHPSNEAIGYQFC